MSVLDSKGIRALKSLKVHTGSLACLGCEYYDRCDVRGCSLIRAALAELEWHYVPDMPKDEEMKLVSCRTQKGAVSTNRAWWDGNFWHGSGSMAGVYAWREMPTPADVKEAEDGFN